MKNATPDPVVQRLLNENEALRGEVQALRQAAGQEQAKANAARTMLAAILVVLPRPEDATVDTPFVTLTQAELDHAATATKLCVVVSPTVPSAFDVFLVRTPEELAAAQARDPADQQPPSRIVRA